MYQFHVLRPMIPLQAGLSEKQVETLEELYEYPLLLSPSQIASGIRFPGSQDRLTKFCEKLLSGQAVTIAVLGGSWTTGTGVENLANAWVPHFFAWIDATFPNPDHKLVNNAVRGVTTGFVAPCLHSFVPADADLVLLEFDINDSFYDITENAAQKWEWWEDRFESPARRTFERMLRQLMMMQNSPAIIYMHAWAGHRDWGTFYWGVEDKYDAMLTYYGLVSLSMRNSLHEMLVQQPELQTQIWPADEGHPTCLGTRLFSDLLIAFLMQSCAQTVLADSQHSFGDHQRPSGIPSQQLPSPLFSNNHMQHSAMCFESDLAMQPIITGIQGFTWTNEGREHNPRLGYISTSPGDHITLQVEHSMFDNHTGSLVLGVGLLTSYEHMGMLEMACLAGCTCNTTLLDTCSKTMTWSQPRWGFLHMQVRPPDGTCIVQLTNSARTSSCPGNKLKVLALLLSGPAEVAELAPLGLTPHAAALET